MSVQQFAFMGTSDFAVIILRHLLQAGIRPNVVYTQPPRAKGRGMHTTLTPVGNLAKAEDIPLIMPDSLDDPAIVTEWQNLQLDAAIVVSYGMKLPESFLQEPKYGCINVHPSLLPRWRGAAPLERAIEAGDTEGGISIIRMNAGIDTGPILAQIQEPIPQDINGGAWHDHTAMIGAQLLIDIMQRIDNITPVDQDKTGVCYAKMFRKPELELDFNQTAESLYHKIRAFSPKPGAWCWWNKKRFRLFSAKIIAQNNRLKVENGTIINKILYIQTKDGFIQPTLMQLEGRKTVSLDDFLNGHRFNIGEKMGND